MDNMGDLILDAVNAEGTAATEPNCTIEFVRLDQVTIARANHVQFPPPHRFRLPAFPQAQNLRCVMTPSLYRIVQSEFFTLDDGEEKNDSALLLRDPAQWRPDFTAWNVLSAGFDAMKAALSGHLVKLKHGPDVGVVNAGVYDGMTSPALVLAKTALLNLFVVLNAQNDPVSENPWFSMVQQILVIDQERFVARVDDAFFTSIEQISTHLDDFKSQGFFPGDTSLHTDNIPSDYTLTAPMISVKRSFEQGNLQFTMARVTNAAGNAVLLDCDMDEHSNIIEHVSDLFTHVFTGGTNPIDIHEYIVHHTPNIDLGYTLRPRSPMLAPMALRQPGVPPKKKRARARSARRA